MFKTFFTFEIKDAFKHPTIYVLTAMIMLLTFGASVSDKVNIGQAVGNIYRNSPFSLSIYTALFSMFGIFFAENFFNQAALREHKNDFAEILYAAPLSKFSYFFGRFAGALVLATIPLCGVFLGSWLASVVGPLVGWMPAERFGPFYFSSFISNYLLFILPNMIFGGAVIFALATKWKSNVISSLGAFFIFICYILAQTFMTDIENESLAAILDVFGSSTLKFDTKYFTPVEKNTISLGVSSMLFVNRLIWLGVSAVIIGISYYTFSFKSKLKKTKRSVKEAQAITNVISMPSVSINYGMISTFQSFFKMNFNSIIKSPTFKIMLVSSVVVLFINLSFGFELYGLKSYPVTYKVIDFIGANSNLFMMMVMVFFAGEMVWRDRESKLNEVLDVTPHNTFLMVVAKYVTLVATCTMLYGVFVLSGIAFQTIEGFKDIDYQQYLLRFLYVDVWTFAIWSGIVLSIQTLLNNKQLSYFISGIVFIGWGFLMSAIGVDSNLMRIGSRPNLVFSDMNGFGPGLTSALWFNVYWLLFAVLCIFLTVALWNRGYKGKFKDRLKVVPKQLSGSYKWMALATVFVWGLVGGIIFYNTKVLNKLVSQKEKDNNSVAYEKAYKQYQGIAVPKLIAADYTIDIYPEERDFRAKVFSTYRNVTDEVIDSLHFSYNEGWGIEIKVPNAEVVHENKDLRYIIFKLDHALKPNDSIAVEIISRYAPQGFENGVGKTEVVKNGTFVNCYFLLPRLGYNASFELQDKFKRKLNGLPEKDKIAELNTDTCAVLDNNFFTHGLSDYIDVETVISTSKDQTAIAPGSLVEDWFEGDRHYFRYKLDHASQDFYTFISAKFEKATRKWNDVDIEIYYDQKHPYNINMMLDAVERSLDYYTQKYGSYYHKQCRIIEFPRYGHFAQAFPGTMPYSEGVGFITNLSSSDNNVIDKVISHEMAHQWFGHQVVGADMEGAQFLNESLTEYSALMTMKNIAETPMKMREFLKYEHDMYLGGRSYGQTREVPINKVDYQSYIYYSKGSVLLYALQDYIGEDVMNDALKDYLNEYRYQNSDYPSSVHFTELLKSKMPDSLQYLISDWIEDITLYDNRLEDATYTQTEAGKYLVTMNLHAAKMKADSIGNESPVMINDWVDIGFFLDDKEEQLYHRQRVLLDKEKMTFTYELDTLPVKAAVDPCHLLIDRVYKDNVKLLAKK